MENLAKHEWLINARQNNYAKRFITAILATGLVLTSGNSAITVFAEETKTSETESENLDFGTYVTSEALTADELLNQARWLSHPASKHGYAAEEANSFYDRLKGTHSEVVGYDNVENGPDRIIFNRDDTKVLIQDKYYSSAKGSIDACFDSEGQFRYIDSDGKAMVVEVPSDQYDECVQLMKSKIQAGKVPGVTDPNEAENLVKKGNLSFKQAVNLTKAGNIDSLKYDAAHSCVVAATAFGISTTIDFVIRLHNGEDYKEALKESAVSGLKTGAKAFAISVITLQLSKTAVVNLFKPGAEALVNVCGKTFAETLLKAYGANAAGASAAQTAAVNLLKTQALTQTVTLVILTLPDVIQVIEGRESGQQLIKNLGITVAGLVGGTAGYVAGSIAGGTILAGPGNIVGGLIGSFAGGALASYLAKMGFDQLIIDDAEAMMDIIETEFCNLCEDYLITEDEAGEIADKLGTVFTDKVFKDMYQSKDRNAFAREQMTGLFEEVNSNRETIHVPTDFEMRYALMESLNGVVYIH